MKTIGIIAEYNPFHNGHAYQIEEIRKKTHADFVVAAMSGDFVQRGAPAIIDKYARTKMALSHGADLVIELPTLWATASAEHFAMAGVTLFDKMGCIDGICFGAETDDLAMLTSLADILAHEPADYQKALTSYLKEGMAFPSARARALLTYLTMHPQTLNTNSAVDAYTKAFSLSEISSILDAPNNILALEYLKAINRRHSHMTPYAIRRKGAGYHDTDLTMPNASATAIRKALSAPIPHPAMQELCTADTQHSVAGKNLALLRDTMPDTSFDILASYLEEYTAIEADDFSSILGYLLLSRSKEGFSDIADCNADISNRLTKSLYSFRSFSQFCEWNKSKDITYTRMSRILTHLLLGHTQDNYNATKQLDYIPYLRILGFRKNSSGLLKELKQTATVPVIAKLADARSQLTPEAFSLLEKDIFSADLYEQIMHQKTSNTLPTSQVSLMLHKKTTPRSEYTREIVRI